ncbi:MAG: ABC transporter substrate-binding protein [Deltaproteobacteria bacterium]|jgi:peptide/nickel transport system substrate-binding protein|nr:ABC transporter substrate-binding protein [Deltaproteobacteria bacterium]
MKKNLLILCLAILIAIPSGVMAAGGSKDTLVYAAYGDIKDWDPSVAFSMEVVMLVSVYEPLVWYNPPGSPDMIRPALARSWETSPDGLTWTFHLRKGVKFHDGELFNAAAVKYSIDRTMKMKKGAYYIWSAVKEIKVVDDYTVQFLLKEPAPIDLIASSQYGAYIFSPKAGEKGTDWFMQGNAAGTGPYQVDSWEKSQQVVLKKFDDYWQGWDGDHFDRVVIKVVLEKSTQVQMIKSGEADFASLAPVDALPALRKAAGVEVITPKSWKNSMFLINTKKFPTDNPKIRQALNYAWDFNGVVNSIYDGLATVAEGPVPKTMWGHNPNLPKYEFNLKKAEQLLKESGIPKDKLKLSLAYIGTSQEYENCAQLLQANLAKIGVQLELLPGPWGTIWEKAKNLETAPNLQSMTWWPTYPTPNDWLIGMFRTEEKALFNLSHYSNPKVDTLIDTGVKMEGVDRDAAIQAYQDAQKIIVEEAPAIFYADIASRVVKRSSVKGFVYNPAYNSLFYYQLYRK